MRNATKRNLLRGGIGLMGALVIATLTRMGYESVAEVSAQSPRYPVHDTVANFGASGAGLLFWESSRRFLKNHGCLQEYLPLPFVTDDDFFEQPPAQNKINERLKISTLVVASLGIGYLLKFGYENFGLYDHDIVENHIFVHGIISNLLSTLGAIGAKETIEEIYNCYMLFKTRENQPLLENNPVHPLNNLNINNQQ